ncbi:unnamed protein product, partial [Amoebophrya sp. A25]|eukprot:GSA25T00024853001.1
MSGQCPDGSRPVAVKEAEDCERIWMRYCKPAISKLVADPTADMPFKSVGDATMPPGCSVSLDPLEKFGAYNTRGAFENGAAKINSPAYRLVCTSMTLGKVR